MLKAVLHGKAGKVSIGGYAEELGWRELFRKREDLLTAVFFGRLQYLSEAAVLGVMTILVGDERARSLGKIDGVEFWPRLRGLKGRSHVEPDVLIFFENSLLMVEVKPPFGGDQNEEQWAAQIESLLLQRKSDSAEIDVPETFHFLALGRNRQRKESFADDMMKRFSDEGLGSISFSEWDEVCVGIRALGDSCYGRDRVVIDDWLDAFALFGLIERPKPFSDLLRFSNCDLDVLKMKMFKQELLDYLVPPQSQYSSEWGGLMSLTERSLLEVALWK